MNKQTFTTAKETTFPVKGIKETLDEIYSKIDIPSALQELNPVNRGNYYAVDCHECKTKGAAYIYHGNRVIDCNKKNNCGIRTRLWEYIQARDNLGPQETLKKLAEYAGVELQEPSEEIIKKIDAQNRNEEIITKIQRFFIEQLWSDAGTQTRNYLLKKRSYPEEDIRKMKLGFNPGYEKTKKHLCEKHQLLPSDTETALNFLKSRDSHPITFPYCDASGRIKTLWGRTLDPNEKAKYLPYSETNKSCPFGLHTARGEREIIVVEGYMDQMVATAKGLTNVVATGGSELTNAQISTLTRTRCKRVLLFLDNDDAGRKGTENSIKRLNKADLEVFVVKIPTGYKDPDVLICKKGTEAFQVCIEKAQSDGTWLAETIPSKYNIATDLGRRDTINEASDWFKKLDPISKQDLKNKLSTVLDIPKEKWEAEALNAKQQKAEKKHLDNWKAYVKQAQILTTSKNLEELSKLKKPQLLLTDSSSTIELISQSVCLNEIVDEIKNPKHLPIGTGFESFDLLLGGGLKKSELVVISGGAGAGKSAFALQVGDQIASKGVCVLYISIEIGRTRLTERSLKRLSFRKILDANKNTRIDTAVKKYEKFAENIFIVKGHPGMTISDIKIMVKTLQDKTDKDVVLIIDPLQRLGTGKEKIDYYNETLKVNHVCDSTKEMAEDLNLPIIALSDTVKNHKGNLTGEGAARGTYMVDHTADVVMMIRASKNPMIAMYGEKEPPSDEDPFVENIREKITGSAFLEKFEINPKNWNKFASLVTPKARNSGKFNPLFYYRPAFHHFTDTKSWTSIISEKKEK